MVFLSAAAFLSSALLISAQNLTSKRGMAFSAAETPGDIINANQTKSQISWQYDWGSIPPEYLAVDGIEYIPMQWGSANIEGFADAVQTQGAKTILAFNEPDFDQESNIQPSEAASLWKQYIEPLKANGIRLGAPAVTASGQPWFAQFMQACSGCSVDFIPLHWYGDGVEGFYNYLWQVHGTYPNISLWVTEFASTSLNATEVANFLNASIAYIDTLPWIERYAWFGYFRPRDTGIYSKLLYTMNNFLCSGYADLLGGDGSLNALGQIYVGAKTVHTQIVPTKTFTSVNGADNPTQGLVTTFPSFPNAALRRWILFGAEGHQALDFGFAVLVFLTGAIWTVF